MHIALEEWQELTQLAEQAAAAVKQLDDRLIDMALSKHQEAHLPETKLLIGLSVRLSNLGLGYFTSAMRPKEEWMGGNSSDPANFKYREPECVPGLSSKKYFPKVLTPPLTFPE